MDPTNSPPFALPAGDLPLVDASLTSAAAGGDADERTQLPLVALNAAIGSGLISPEHLPLLGQVWLAPGVPVDAALLSWHPGLKEIVYRGPSAALGAPVRVVRLSRISDALNHGNDEIGWVEVEVMPGTPARWQRFCVELGMPLFVMETHVYEQCAPRGDPGMPSGVWQISAARGDYQLIDVTMPGRLPQFTSASEACAAADAGVLGDAGGWRWVHRAVPLTVLTPS